MYRVSLKRKLSPTNLLVSSSQLSPSVITRSGSTTPPTYSPTVIPRRWAHRKFTDFFIKVCTNESSQLIWLFPGLWFYPGFTWGFLWTLALPCFYQRFSLDFDFILALPGLPPTLTLPWLYWSFPSDSDFILALLGLFRLWLYPGFTRTFPNSDFTRAFSDSDFTLALLCCLQSDFYWTYILYGHNTLAIHCILYTS